MTAAASLMQPVLVSSQNVEWPQALSRAVPDCKLEKLHLHTPSTHGTWLSAGLSASHALARMATNKQHELDGTDRHLHYTIASLLQAAALSDLEEELAASQLTTQELRAQLADRDGGIGTEGAMSAVEAGGSSGAPVGNAHVLALQVATPASISFLHVPCWLFASNSSLGGNLSQGGAQLPRIAAFAHV